ncbi:hypothetical protein [Streptomyces erythrochromogenes]|uniref:hypothetical protein n=1 Tax=Streptomyces erythrochromogenes TaxID=285574 RepID=UPI00225A5815|nr:hypothetical protein [Streptomyces erythrochromogenes]MCX5589542.1 hypothetical protein [Streptomyces erythrochromogenes]
MNTSAPRPRRRPSVPAPGAAAPRRPLDRAKVGRSSVRRRATGMTATEATAALEDARLQQHIDRDCEELADDERGPAEIAEWERIAQLLATTGGTYDPAADAFVQDELAEDRRREEAEQQRRQEQQRVADRAAELAALAGAGRLDGTVPSRPGDEAARALLDDYDYRVATVDDWFAHALATRSGHYADPDTRKAAATLLPVPVRARAALLAALARTGAPVDGDLEFVGRLAQADPDATTALAAWLDSAAAVKGGTV